MRLSKLEKRIITELYNAVDNHNINSYEDYYDAGPPVKYSVLFQACYDDWPDNGRERYKKNNSRKVAFSRAAHRLVKEKGLVLAVALAWHHITKDVECWAEWQGGGYGEKVTYGDVFKTVYKNKTPVYRMLTLTEEGLQLAMNGLASESHNKELEGWAESEIERRQQVEAGLAVVANKRKEKGKGKDENLINWASGKGLFVEIDRGSKWGNDDDRQGEKYRQEVCESFIKQYAASETMQAEIGELKGKVLGCWCYPKQCHGDYLAEQANKER